LGRQSHQVSEVRFGSVSEMIHAALGERLVPRADIDAVVAQSQVS